MLSRNVNFGRIRLGVSRFTFGENHFRNKKSIEIVLNAKNFEAQNTHCVTVFSVKHFFLWKKVLHAKTREGRTAQSNAPNINALTYRKEPK